MTTRTYFSSYSHATVADFRIWGAELRTNLLAAGLVAGADTGQIDWVTVALPAINVAAGYEIWRSPDSSLYYKLEFGTGGVVGQPQIWITVGTGSNGTGTLTGQLSTRVTAAGYTPTSTTLPYYTYICVTNDYFMLDWKHNSTATSLVPAALIIVGKTVDEDGDATSMGYAVITQVTTTINLQSVRLAAPAITLTASTWYSLVPGHVTSSLIGPNAQLYLWLMNIPEVMPFMYAASYVAVELGEVSNINATLVGATPHVYKCLGGAASGHVGAANNNTAGYGIAVLWE